MGLQLSLSALQTHPRPLTCPSYNLHISEPPLQCKPHAMQRFITACIISLRCKPSLCIKSVICSSVHTLHILMTNSVINACTCKSLCPVIDSRTLGWGTGVKKAIFYIDYVFYNKWTLLCVFTRNRHTLVIHFCLSLCCTIWHTLLKPLL